MSTTRTPHRTEIPESDQWDLAPLYPSDVDWERDFSRLQETYPGVREFRGRLGESARALARAGSVPRIDAFLNRAMVFPAT